MKPAKGQEFDDLVKDYSRYAPGVTPLGWTLHVDTNGEVILNHQLGSTYYCRIRDELEDAGYTVISSRYRPI